MEYDKSMFGEGIKVYNHGSVSSGQTLYDFTIGSQNANLSAAYKSGAMKNNGPLPDNLFYWLASENSPYNRMSFIYRTGTSPNFNYQKIDTPENKAPVPLVLWAGATKINPNTYDVDIENGTSFATYGNNSRLIFNSSTFNIQTSQTPLWEINYGHNSSVYANGVYSSLPFILDFDYNNFILKIRVGQGNSFVDLAEYVNDSNHYIDSIAIELYTGDVSTGNSRIARNSRTDENGNNIVFGDNQNDCYYVVTDFDYKTPEVYAENYQYPTYRKLARLGTTNVHILFSGTNVTTNLLNATPYFFIEDDKWEIVNSTYRLKKSENTIYSEDDFNYIRKLIAFLGFWFTDGGIYTDSEHSYRLNRVDSLLGDNANTYAESYMIPNKIYQSEIVDGITTGNFTELRIAKDNEQSKWGKDWRNKNGYDGRDGVRPTDESSKSSKATYSSALASFGNIWLMNNSGISNLANALKTFVTNEQDPYDPTLFYGQNPVECIISIKEYPIDISSCIDVIKNPEPVSLGRWNNIIYTDGGIGVRLAAPLVTVKSASEPFSHITISIPAHYKDLGYPFMDYEPYSSYHLYLPFCGTVKIPSELAIESRIEVLYYADVLSGACIAHVYINYKYYCSAQGQLATEVPVSGYKISDYTRDMLNATYAQKQAYASITSDVGRIVSSAGGAGITLGISDKRAWGNEAPSVFSKLSAGSLTKLGGLTMGFGTAIQAGADMWSKYETIKYNKTILDHSAPAPVKSSLGGGLVNWESPYFVEMLVQRPVFMEGYNKDVFNATMGRACYLADTLGNHSGGYVEAINCKLSGFPATQTEKVELAKLLADGVFL